MQLCRSSEIIQQRASARAKMLSTMCSARTRLIAGSPVASFSNKMRRQQVRVMNFREESSSTGAKQMIKAGDKIPNDAAFYVLDRQAEKPKMVRAQDIFPGKKVVLFGLPGAFTSVCSSKHAPGFNAKYDVFRERGIDKICCTSVNDAYVMAEWGTKLNIDPERVMMLADGDATFHSQTGLMQTIEGLGGRARRYSMYVEDGTVRILNVDEKGPMSYKVSGPDRMLADLEALEKAEPNATRQEVN